MTRPQKPVRCKVAANRLLRVAGSSRADFYPAVQEPPSNANCAIKKPNDDPEHFRFTAKMDHPTSILAIFCHIVASI